MTSRLLCILALCLPALAFAADKCATEIGTATGDTNCGGTCDATDYATAATCYNTAAQGSSSLTTALTNLADGDVLNIDDGIHPITTSILGSSMTTGGSVTIQCRTATRGSCGTTQSSATAATWSLGNASVTFNFTLKNLACTRSSTFTSTSTGMCVHSASSATGNIVVDSMYAHDITQDVGSGTTTTSAVFNIGSSSNKTLTIQGSTLVANVSCSGGDVVACLIRASGTNDVAVTGLEANGITMTGTEAAIRCDDDCDLSGLYVRWVTVNDSANKWLGFINDAETSIAGGLANSTFLNMTIAGVSPDTFTVKFFGPFVISNLTLGDSTCTQTDNSVTSCTGFLAQDSSASGTVTDVSVSGVTGQYGVCGYASQGGALSISRLRCQGNTFAQGLVYFGGWGTSTLASSVITGNTQNALGEAVEGGVFNCQLQSSATSDRTCAMYHVTAVDNTLQGSAVGSVNFRNNVTNDTACGGATCNNTLLITDSIIRNGKAQEIVPLVTDADVTDVLTITTSNLTDKDDPTPATGGNGAVTETLTGNIESDPQFMCTDSKNPSCYKPRVGSPLRDAGTWIPSATTDYRGCKFRKPPTIGAFEHGCGDP